MSKLILHKGQYRGTDGNGNDHYAADYYLVSEVDAHIKELEAKIDALMLEYCPDEMTQKQIDEWARNVVEHVDE